MLQIPPDSSECEAGLLMDGVKHLADFVRTAERLLYVGLTLYPVGFDTKWLDIAGLLHAIRLNHSLRYLRLDDVIGCEETVLLCVALNAHNRIDSMYVLREKKWETKACLPLRSGLRQTSSYATSL